MSIFGSIMSAIFGHAGASQASAAPAPSATQSPTPGQSTPSAAQSAPPGPTPSPGQQSPVDVEAVLTKLNAQKKQKLDWRHSIVDLMKLLDLDSSLAARKELAKELHYSGDANDSARMNIWLHKQVMIKLAENGGRVPEELKKAS